MQKSTPILLSLSLLHLHQHLLQSRLVEVNPDPSPRQLGDVVRVMISGADFLTLDMLRLRLLAPVSTHHCS